MSFGIEAPAFTYFCRELEKLKLAMANQAITLGEMTKEKQILTFKLNETQQVKNSRIFVMHIGLSRWCTARG